MNTANEVEGLICALQYNERNRVTKYTHRHAAEAALSLLSLESSCPSRVLAIVALGATSEGNQDYWHMHTQLTEWLDEGVYSDIYFGDYLFDAVDGIAIDALLLKTLNTKRFAWLCRLYKVSPGQIVQEIDKYMPNGLA